MYTYLCVCVFVFNHIRGRWSPITSSSTGGQNFQCLPWDGDPRGQNCLRHDFLMKIMYNIYIYMCVCIMYASNIMNFWYSPSPSSKIQFLPLPRLSREDSVFALGESEDLRMRPTWCHSVLQKRVILGDVERGRGVHTYNTLTHGERESDIYIYILYIQLLIITSIYSIHMYIHTICHMFLFIYL